MAGADPGLSRRGRPVAGAGRTLDPPLIEERVLTVHSSLVPGRKLSSAFERATPERRECGSHSPCSSLVIVSSPPSISPSAVCGLWCRREPRVGASRSMPGAAYCTHGSAVGVPVPQRHSSSRACSTDARARDGRPMRNRLRRACPENVPLLAPALPPHPSGARTFRSPIKSVFLFRGRRHRLACPGVLPTLHGHRSERGDAPRAPR
jgi:hypothetical protein